MTITEFLLDRIRERETLAQAALEHWASDRDGGWFNGLTDETAAHVLQFHPVRVLAECEASRRIVFRHDGPHECPSGGTDLSAPCSTLHHLAQPYADHADHDPKWLV